MSHKPWIWRKRSSEKTISAESEVIAHVENMEEIQRAPTVKDAALKRTEKNLNEKLASVLLACHTYDEPSVGQEEHAHQKIKGLFKEEAADDFLKKEVDEDLLNKVTSKECLMYSDESLQLVSIEEEEEEQELKGEGEEAKRTLYDAFIKMSSEHEKLKAGYEEKLRESSKRLTDLANANFHLNKTVLEKEKYIEELQKQKSQLDADTATLMGRLDSTEKENAFLKYEFCMLEKELEVRKEEMDYNRRYAETSQKQYLESVQKITTLEAECQSLRLLAQKESYNPVALVNAKSGAKVVGRETEMKRRKPDPKRALASRNSKQENSPEALKKRISLMVKQLQDLLEENETLQGIISRKDNELQTSRSVHVQAASKLSEAELEIRRLSKLQNPNPSKELAVLSDFDKGGEDMAKFTKPRTNSLMQGPETFRTGKLNHLQELKANELPDMSLLDDFVEMEKFAVISVDRPQSWCSACLTGKELVPVGQHLDYCDRQEVQSKRTTEKPFDWLQVVLKAMLEQKRISQRSLDELFEDLKIVLGYVHHRTSDKADANIISRHPEETHPLTDNLPVELSSKSKPADGRNNQLFQSNLSKSILTIIKLLEGVNPTSSSGNGRQNSNFSLSQNSKGYFVRVFQWKVSELDPVLRGFIHTCKELLSGNAGIEDFAEEVAFALDWTMHNHANPRDASVARDRIKRRLTWNEFDLKDERKIGFEISDRQKLQHAAPVVSSPGIQAENRKLRDEMRSIEIGKKDLEDRLLLITQKNENMLLQLQEAEKTIKILQSHLETEKKAKAIVEDQMEKQKSINEDLDTQLTIAQAKINEIIQKFSSLEVELEDKNHSCEDLETTCLELQLQLESMLKKDSSNMSPHEMEKHSRTGLEIRTASVKLAECQETILNLGRQLEALAPSSEMSLLNRVLSRRSTVTTMIGKNSLTKRSSLRKRMQAEDEAKALVPGFVQSDSATTTKQGQLQTETIHSNHSVRNYMQVHDELLVDARKRSSSHEHNGRNNATGTLAIVPSEKGGRFALLRKLFFIRKKGGRRKSSN